MVEQTARGREARAPRGRHRRRRAVRAVVPAPAPTRRHRRRSSPRASAYTPSESSSSSSKSCSIKSTLYRRIPPLRARPRARATRLAPACASACVRRPATRGMRGAASASWCGVGATSACHVPRPGSCPAVCMAHARRAACRVRGGCARLCARARRVRWWRGRAGGGGAGAQPAEALDKLRALL
eukprot:3102234-Prymnesium_polylepis.1